MTLNLCRHCSDRGMCCRYVELPLARPLTQDEGNWVNLHPGVRMVAANTIRIETKCSALTDEGNCSLFGTSQRPAMCGVWPDAKEQIPVGCAYEGVF